jgi:hypothetical protein
MAREIFCKNCDFYIEDPDFKYPTGKNTGTDIHTVCICPYNIDEEYDPKDPHKFISCPSIINRNHDCNWFRVAQKIETYVWTHSNKVPKYKGHGPGTYNINPKNGADGFYIGEKTLSEIINEKASISGDISSQLEQLKQTDQKLAQDIIDVNENLVDLYEQIITPLVQNVQDVKVRVESHDKKITDYDQKIITQDDKIKQMESKINSSEQELTRLKNEVSDALTTVENLEKDVTNAVEEVEKVVDKVEEMDYNNITIINCGSATEEF